MKHSMHISFQLKKSKTNKKGLTPINLRITIDGKRAEISTHRSIFQNNWDNAIGRPIGNYEEIIILNNYLDSLKSKVQRQYNIFESLGMEITAETIKNKLTGKAEDEHTLIEAFTYHNEQFKLKVGSDFSEYTYRHYKVTHAKVKAFLKHKYKKSDIRLDDLNHSFVTSFELYLKTHDLCAHNTTMKHIVKLKKIINLAIFNEWINHNPFSNFKCSMKPTNRGYLSPSELQTLQQKTFTIPRLQKVLDIFIFCCYTGLSWSDAEKLTTSDIKLGIDGEKWIIIYRKKTDTRSPIPILPQAMAIIEKYRNNPEAIAKGRLLPVNSNQRMNGYLKEIQDICEIPKRLTMHLARHTFATTVTLANGVPIETVSKMLGHTSIKTTQIYSKVVDSKISDDMKKLKRKTSLESIKNAI